MTEENKCDDKNSAIDDTSVTSSTKKSATNPDYKLKKTKIGIEISSLEENSTAAM